MRPFPTILGLMGEWLGDLSILSAAEVVQLKTANRLWGKELRLASAELVNRRLASQISREEYAAGRQRGKEEAAEQRRRASVLADMIPRRG